MSVKWILREVLAQRGFTTASEIGRIIQERTRYSISTQAVCDLLNDEPKMLRIETAQALCDAFGLQVGEFFDVGPGPPASWKYVSLLAVNLYISPKRRRTSHPSFLLQGSSTLPSNEPLTQWR
jgi:hypothetical protein